MCADELPPLPLTGERTVPGVPQENYWFQRHVIAYEWAAARCRGKTVVDAGAGEGYGVAILARRADAVLGIELVGTVVDHAQAAYPGHTFLRADVCDTGLPAASVDAVVSLQVIEHLPDLPRFLGEVRRILRPGGQLMVGTPNRLTFSPHDHHGADPTNIFHVEEFTAEELVRRLWDAGGLVAEQVLGVHHGPAVRRRERHLDRPLAEALLAPVPERPRWLRTVVGRITPADFRLSGRDVDRALDLLAVARVGSWQGGAPR